MNKFFIIFIIYFCFMISIIYGKYKNYVKKHGYIDFLPWMNIRIMDLNTTITLKAAEWQTRKYEKSLKKEQEKKKKQMNKWGFN